MAPIFSAGGGYTPMTSGRGLGHTGGTLDKLESIAGMNVHPCIDQGLKILRKHGLVYMGQTDSMAPADRKLYALRDVTSTVECIELITSSILSKKYADAIVFDVKCGSGAFMKSLEDAEQLANTLVNVAKRIPQKSVALVTNMNQPLGCCVGNGLEIKESIEVLQGKQIDDLVEISIALSAQMFYLSGKSKSIAAGEKKARKLLQSGKAWDKFYEVVKAQGGDISYLENPDKLVAKAKVYSWQAKQSGYIQSMDTAEVGRAAILLGAGRNSMADKIDHKVGFVFHKKIGDKIKKGDTIAEIYYGKKGYKKALAALETATTFSNKKTTLDTFVYKTIS
jgi:pyrimidine-nucleoside phosphorylase